MKQIAYITLFVPFFIAGFLWSMISMAFGIGISAGNELLKLLAK